MKTLNSNKRLLNKVTESFRKSLNVFTENPSENTIQRLKDEVRQKLLEIEDDVNVHFTTNCITETFGVNLNPKVIELSDGQILGLQNIPKYKSLGNALSEAIEAEEIQLICSCCKEKITYVCSEFNNVFEDYGELCCQNCKTPWLEFSYEK